MLNIRCGIDFQMPFFHRDMVMSAYLYFLWFDKPALYCICHLLCSQKMTGIVLIEKTFIPHNLPFCASDKTLAWLGLREC